MDFLSSVFQLIFIAMQAAVTDARLFYIILLFLGIAVVLFTIKTVRCFT